ncbi:MAG: DUF5683 domain-containing protein [Myxococcales bacterium]|nr:DUF5683 domain-containing protein [Myxococcales bacterium]MDH3845204.1 DUF5683 domain-containing protein [Myxococcales bacterium]
MNRPGTAAILSFILPGAGQIYNGKFLRGVVWLIITPGFWLGTGGFFGWVCHLISSYMAYQWAKDNPPSLALNAND